MSSVKALLHEKLVGVLTRHIEPLFKPGVRFAIIARLPGNNEADVLVTNDKINELVDLLQRRRAAQENE
jgi:hypothetical protein